MTLPEKKKCVTSTLSLRKEQWDDLEQEASSMTYGNLSAWVRQILDERKKNEKQS